MIPSMERAVDLVVVLALRKCQQLALEFGHEWCALWETHLFVIDPSPAAE